MGRASELPDRPTGHKPGTRQKLAVLARRARAGTVLFHPLDADSMDGLARVADLLGHGSMGGPTSRKGIMRDCEGRPRWSSQKEDR